MSLPSGLEKPLQRFYEYLRSERELSLHTQQNYKRQLTTMAEQLVSLGVDNWQAVDAGWVRQLASKGMRDGLKASSLSMRLSALRSFFDYLVQQGLLKANPAKGVSAPRKARPLPKNLDVDEMDQLLSVDEDDPLSIRDRAMMELMYGAGLRLSELVSLDVKNVSLRKGDLRVIGKGDKERIVPSPDWPVSGSVIGSRSGANWLRPVSRGCLFPSSDSVFPTATSRSEWRSGARSRPSPAISTRTSCAIALLPICSSHREI